MADIKRADPGPSRVQHSKTNWSDVFADLRKEPWEWFSIGEFPSAYVTHIKRGRFAGNTEGEFEATMRNTNRATQRGELFVRFVGAPKPEGIDPFASDE